MNPESKEENSQEANPSTTEKRKVSQSESGHAINVANFEHLESFCIGYGLKYQPTRSTIMLPALAALRTSSVAVITSLNNLNSVLALAIDDREDAIAPLSPLCTRVFSGASVSNVSDSFVEDLKSVYQKLHGERITPLHPTLKDNPNMTEEEFIKNISTSQMSFDRRIENFSKFIILLSLEPNYIPNETDLTVASLTAYYNTLKTANTAVINANTNASNKRIERNVILYHPQTGLVKIASLVKTYIKSVFGARSQQYRQVTKLQFKAGSDLANKVK